MHHFRLAVVSGIVIVSQHHFPLRYAKPKGGVYRTDEHQKGGSYESTGKRFLREVREGKFGL